MKILITRESVAMSDDADAPHHCEMTVADSVSLQAIIKDILQSRYLATISGGKATWILLSRFPIAIVAQQ